MALGDLTKQLVLDAMRQPETSAPVADSGNVGSTMLGQVQAMQKALKEDQELVVLCRAGGETIRALEFFMPSWQVAVITGVNGIARVVAPIESLQLVCKVVKAQAKPTRINFVIPKA